MTGPDDSHVLPPLNPTDQAAYELGLEIRTLAAEAVPGWLHHAVDAALNHPHPFPRGEARIALQLAPQAEAVAALLPPLSSPNRRLRRRAMTLLPKLDPGELSAQLAAWLPSAPRVGRRAACVVLAAIGEAARPLLTELAVDEDDALARRAVRALDHLDQRRATTGPGPLRASAQRPFGLHPPAQPLADRPRSFAIAAFNLSYGVNLGVLVRSAEAAGAEAVWIVGRDFYYRPSTKGSDWWIPIEIVETAEACVDRARDQGFEIVALQQGTCAVPLYDAPWPERPLIVVGNEGDGLPPALVDAAALHIEIPVYGEIDSLNVAMAASVAMYQFRAWQSVQ